MFRKGKWGQIAEKRPPTERKWSPAVRLQRVGRIRKAKVGWICKDRPQSAKEHLPPNRKGIVPLKRKRTAEAVPMRCQYSLPLNK